MQKKYRLGFTLIELLVVLVIMSLVLVVVVPKIGSIYDRQLVEEQVEILEKELTWLRGEAMYTGQSASLKCLDAQSYSLTVHRSKGLESEIRQLVNKRVRMRIETKDQQIVFAAAGTAYEKGRLVIQCGDELRTIVVNNYGRIRVGVGKTS